MKQETTVKAKNCDCGNVGFYVHANVHTGEPEQEQCQFCYEEKGSVFNLMAQAHMAGQSDAGVDPSWSNATCYVMRGNDRK